MVHVQILSMDKGNGTRRQRFIIACALAFGLGVSFVPQWAENNLWPEPENASSVVLGIRLAVLLILETGFCIGALVAFLLNLIIPDEQPGGAADLLPVDIVSTPLNPKPYCE
jgi:NCS2 family nucleobase:cation symporter-2